MRYQWGGAFQAQLVPEASRGVGFSRCRLEIANGALPEIVSILGMTSMAPTELVAADAFESSVRVENPPWVQNADFLGMTYGGKGVAWVLQRHQEDDDLLVIASYSSLGDLIATHAMRVPFSDGQDRLKAPVPMIYACEQIVFLCGQHLVRFYRDRVESLTLEREPGGLEAARVAVAFTPRLRIIW